MSEPQISGAILAGGRSSRMGGGLKAMASLAGRPLVQHVIDRLQPQVGRLMLSVEQKNEALQPLGLEQVEDQLGGCGGPLGGLMSCLEALDENQEWLLLLPCDAPFLPLNLSERLLGTVLADESAIAVVQLGADIQPTFSLWHRSVLAAVNTAVRDHSMGGFKQFLRGADYSRVQWDLTQTDPGDYGLPFFNINTPDELARAEGLIQSGS